MGLEKEVMHVVIKLPFKRPSDFVEPPPVVWTDDMEHQLWKYMNQNQKHIDWNYIADQLGVPTPYLVRHAAFLYETQLRGIQQQLRLSEAGRPTTISSSPPPAVSTSTSSSNTYRSSRPSSQRQVRPVSSSSSSSRTQQQQRNSTMWKDALEQQADDSATLATAIPRPMTTANESTTGSTSSTSPHSRTGYDQSATATHPSITSSSMDIEATAMATAPIDRYQHSPHDDSMMLSTISNISPRNKYSSSNNNLNEADLTPLSSHADNSKYDSSQQHQQQNVLHQSPDTPTTSDASDRRGWKERDDVIHSLNTKYHGNNEQQHGMNNSGDDDHENAANDRDILNNNNNRYDEHENDDGSDDVGLSTQLENMKLQLEEPAFLPSRRLEGSQLLSSLRASSYQSRSALSIPALATSSSPSTKSPSPPSSQRYSSSTTASPSVPLSPTSEQQRSHVTKNTPSKSGKEPAKEDDLGMDGHTFSEDYSIENKTPSSNNDDASDTSSNGKTKMIFGPNLNRTPTTQPSDESNKDANSALNSVGSSFSDLSDSITQSAMEDAFLSNLNNGSKMSSLAFSRKYT